MGRKSREKRERREHGSGPIALAAKGRSLSDLIALLEAASVSPTATHQIPSLALIFDSLMRRTRTGQRPATPELLPKLVEAAHQECPLLSCEEDWLPYDVRSEVLVRWAGDLHRLVPGCLERPVAKVEWLDLLSSVIDRVLIEHNGYGLRDVIELVLRRVDHVASTLAPAWPPDHTPSVGDPARLGSEELAAARELRPIAQQVALCAAPDRASAALERHSVTAKRLAHQPFDPNSSFGSTIAVLAGDREFTALPAGVLMESLDALAVLLAGQACSLDPEVDDHWTVIVANRVGHALAGSGHRTAGPVRTQRGHVIHSVTTYSRRQALVIDTVASLEPAPLQERLQSSCDRLDAVSAGSDLDTPMGPIQIASDADVVKLQVVAAPNAGQALVGGENPIATLEDLLWIARTCAREQVDLWHFVRDLTDPRGVENTFMWDLIDAWEVWRDNGKTFYRGGSPLTAMMFAPHSAEIEWHTAADTREHEGALLALGLPPLSAWPIVDSLTEVNYVGDLTQDSVFRLLSWRVPVAIATTDPSSDATSSTVGTFADGIAWKLEYSQDAFLAAAEASGVSALRIHFSLGDADENGGLPLWLENREERTITIGWDTRLEESLGQDSYAVEALTGRLLAELFPAGQHRDNFISAWDAAPPGIRVDAVGVEQRSGRLPDPIRPHESQRSAAQQRLGEHLMAAGVAPGVYEGSQVTQLESGHVYPWLIKELHHILHPYDSRALLEMALAQFERANFKRMLHDHQIAWQRGFPVHTDSEGDRGEDRRERIAARVRSISLIIEEVLARPPTGEAFPDRAIWQEALSISDLCLESGLRSESVHFNLTHAAVTISDSYEVEVEWSDEPTDVDLLAYTKKRVSGSLPEAKPIGESSVDNPEPETEDPKPILELMPKLECIDSAMRTTLHFGLDALTVALNVARQWDVAAESPVGTTTVQGVVDQAVALGVGATEDEYRHAAEWLTLRGADLRETQREHWETERRAVRLRTRPFVECDGKIYVLPWSAEATLKILSNYLRDGRLPWPRQALPEEVNDALNRYRQGQNRQLELDCVAALKSPDLVIRSNIKPQKARKYGITSLSGEVDVLCVDSLRSRIWVIEAKDLYTPFSHHQIRRVIDHFHEEDGCVDKLLNKVKDIQGSASGLASALGIDQPDRTWEVPSLIVTRNPDPGAFALEARVPFCVLNAIARVVTLDKLPGPGFVEPPQESGD